MLSVISLRSSGDLAFAIVSAANTVIVLSTYENSIRHHGSPNESSLSTDFAIKLFY